MKEVPVGRSGLVALVDDADFDRVSQFRWYLNAYGYAENALPRAPGALRRSQRIHMLILPPIDDFQVDHRNRDKLDNRRGNLRYATHHEQMLNRDNQRRPDGLPRGAYRSRSGGRYRSAITSFGRHRHLGTFDTPEQAHQAWRVAAHETWGFIPGEEIP